VPPGLDVTLNTLSIDEDRIRLQGTTTSFELAERLKSELEKIPFFKEVNVGQVQADQGGEKSFDVTITMGPRGASPPPPAAPAPATAEEGA
jgi:hypothetical protein